MHWGLGGGWGDMCLGRVGAPVSEGAGYKLQCQLDCFSVCPHKLSLGGTFPGFGGNADFGPWLLSHVCQVFFF